MEELSENREQTLEEIFQDVQTVVKTFEKKYNVKIPVFVEAVCTQDMTERNLLIWRSRRTRLRTRFIATHECDASLAYKSVISM